MEGNFIKYIRRKMRVWWQIFSFDTYVHEMIGSFWQNHSLLQQNHDSDPRPQRSRFAKPITYKKQPKFRHFCYFNTAR